MLSIPPLTVERATNSSYGQERRISNLTLLLKVGERRKCWSAEIGFVASKVDFCFSIISLSLEELDITASVTLDFSGICE